MQGIIVPISFPLVYYFHLIMFDSFSGSLDYYEFRQNAGSVDKAVAKLS